MLYHALSSASNWCSDVRRGGGGSGAGFHPSFGIHMHGTLQEFPYNIARRIVCLQCACNVTLNWNDPSWNELLESTMRQKRLGYCCRWLNVLGIICCDPVFAVHQGAEPLLRRCPRSIWMPPLTLTHQLAGTSPAAQTWIRLSRRGDSIMQTR